MLTARRFSEFDISVICHYVLILRSVKLVSTSCKICFIRLKVLALKGQRLKYPVKDSALAYIVTPGPDI